jgi:hypothetical protein
MNVGVWTAFLNFAAFSFRENQYVFTQDKQEEHANARRVRSTETLMVHPFLFKNRIHSLHKWVMNLIFNSIY